MQWRVSRSTLAGTCAVPPSKSHTIRALLAATLAPGRSTIRRALLQGDGESALGAAKAIGAQASLAGDTLTIDGVGGDLTRGSREIDCGNSGTSLRLFSGAVSLGRLERRFDGDESLRTRKMRSLLGALSELGATVGYERDGEDVPFTIMGPLIGGSARVSGVTSQFVSSLLFCTPLAPRNTLIRVVDQLNERPYVELTLWWMRRLGLKVTFAGDMHEFFVEGAQAYKPIDMDIPSDFSSATFPAVAALATRSRVCLTGLDFTDPQGDKEVFQFLGAMGGVVEETALGVLVGSGKRLAGTELDLNATPDALPAMAVLGCIADGHTRLGNVPQARIKETDRIAVMTQELRKMGAQIEELPDGMVTHGGKLQGARVDGHGDHRVVMALAIAGMVADGQTVIDGAEAATVTYPTFLRDFQALGAQIEAV